MPKQTQILSNAFFSFGLQKVYSSDGPVGIADGI